MKLRLCCILAFAKLQHRPLRSATGFTGRLLVIAGSNFAQSGENRARQNKSAKVHSVPMELIIFARFRAREGEEGAVAAELRDAVARVRKEPGCLGIEVYRSVRDLRLFPSILAGLMRLHSTSM
jgi:hypothetical protein